MQAACMVMEAFEGYKEKFKVKKWVLFSESLFGILFQFALLVCYIFIPLSRESDGGAMLWTNPQSTPAVESYAAFTHADLTIRYRTKSLDKTIFVLSSSLNIQCYSL